MKTQRNLGKEDQDPDLANAYRRFKKRGNRKAVKGLLGTSIVLNDLQKVETEDARTLPPEISAQIVEFTGASNLKLKT